MPDGGTDIPVTSPDHAGGDDGTAAVRSVLFVDFDNIYLGLRNLDEAAAEAFAAHPERWVEWLERGAESPRGRARRFLMKCVYLNPTRFGQQRAVFIRSGFRAVDCPSLTAQGKNSADIHMVLDIVDALDRSTLYEDFVLVSADADFTPILHRIRALDRWTTVVTGSPAAAAYRAVADVFVPAEVLAATASARRDEGGATPPSPTDGDVPADVTVAPPGLPEDRARPSPTVVEDVAARMTALVRSSDTPVVSAAVAQAGLQVEPRLKELDWLGTGSFRAFLSVHVPELEYLPQPTPGWVMDPEIHRADDVPRPRESTLSPFLERVCYVTDVPPLSSQGYTSLFRELEAELRSAPFSLTNTSKEVRNRTALTDVPVARGPISFVLKGLAYAGVDLNAGLTAQELADEWVRNVLGLVRSAQISLEPHEEVELRAWLTGDMAPPPT